MLVLFATRWFYLPPKSRLKIYWFFLPPWPRLKTFSIVSLLEEKKHFFVLFTHFVLTDERQRRHF